MFTLPLGDVTIYAIGRQRNTFRFGFEFIESNPRTKSYATPAAIWPSTKP
jgi:hypothetical protein